VPSIALSPAAWSPAFGTVTDYWRVLQHHFPAYLLSKITPSYASLAVPTAGHPLISALTCAITRPACHLPRYVAITALPPRYLMIQTVFLDMASALGLWYLMFLIAGFQ